MKTIFVLFDSLNRKALEPYGGQAVATPNFARFARRAITFDTHYAGSLPCIPARRDMHTGRLNFMHRPWGPLEPFDNSYAKQLSERGVYTHLITDHYHYFEAGGAGYATAFDSWEFIRGQEYDPATVLVQPPLGELKAQYDERHYPLDRLNADVPLTPRAGDRLAFRRMQHGVNAISMTREDQFPLARCFSHAMTFLDANRDAGPWLLQLECFDPHEPFHSSDRFPNRQTRGRGKILDWPAYEKVANSPEEIAEIRSSYAALVEMCDDYFGQLLDWMDRTNAWEDTCLIVTTDHGYLLGEHEWWGKNKMPCYEEIAHIPLMVWHPDHADAAGQRCGALTQTADLMPTFLDLYGLSLPKEARARSILPHLAREVQEEDRTVIFGLFGGPIGATDGRFSCFLYPDVDRIGELGMYTIAPSHMSDPFPPSDLAVAELVGPFDFTKGARLLRVPLGEEVKESGLAAARAAGGRNVLFDLRADPGQENPIENAGVETRLKDAIAAELKRHDAPPEIYRYYGLTEPETTEARRSSATV
jgi:arylsulfatase A-like enzyme